MLGLISTQTVQHYVGIPEKDILENKSADESDNSKFKNYSACKKAASNLKKSSDIEIPNPYLKIPDM